MDEIERFEVPAVLGEIAHEEFSAVLDAAVQEVLEAADWAGPPVDAFQLARRMGMVVAACAHQPERARFVRLARHDGAAARGSILLRQEPRRERRQWAVAHEIGEQTAHDVFRRLHVDPAEAPPTARETVANHLAGRLLLPGDWFRRDAARSDWDLFQLKQRYATASHELIARRMLDFEPPIIITIFDQGKITWRRGNVPGRLPAVTSLECACRQAVMTQRGACDGSSGVCQVQGWPVYEGSWRREILRLHVTAEFDQAITGAEWLNA